MHITSSFYINLLSTIYIVHENKINSYNYLNKNTKKSHKVITSLIQEFEEYFI